MFFKIRRFLSFIKYKIRYLSILDKKYESKSIPKDFGRIASYPYISGDTFLSIADAFVINNRRRYKDYRLDHHREWALLIKSNNEKNIIFIENDLLSIKWVFNLSKKYKKVILHNGDKVPDEKLLKELVRNKIYVFGTNIGVKNEFMEPIPIGIENAYMERDGDLRYYNPINLAKTKIKKKYIVS